MRFARSVREPIPWSTKQSDNFVTWEWKAEHLHINIIGSGPESNRIFHWKIYEFLDGKKVPFDEGDATSFTDSVDQAIEIVAKSWPRHYGYAAYAGHLAFTFKTNDGSMINFQPAIGKEVILIVKDNDGEEMSLTGSLDVRHYDITLTQSSQTIYIPPNRIIDVRSNYGGSMLDDMAILRRSKSED